MRQLAAKALGEEHIPVLFPLALLDPQLAMVQVDIFQLHVGKLGISHTGEEEELNHHHVGRVPPVPHRFIEGDKLFIGQQFR